jgi:hypothetical protein
VPIEVFGVRLLPKGRIIPVPGKPATHFFGVANALKARCAGQRREITGSNRIWKELEKILPTTSFQENEGPSKMASWYTIGFTPTDTSSPGTPYRERMAKLREGHRQFAGCRAVSTFTLAQQKARKDILYSLNSDSTSLKALFERQRDFQVGSNSKLDRHPFFDFLEEAASRFIYFHPCDSLTGTYRFRNMASNRHELAFVHHLHLNELRLLDNRRFYFEMMAAQQMDNHRFRSFNKGHFYTQMADRYLAEIGITFEKIQQFLRGKASMKRIELLYGRYFDFSPHIVKTIGTLTYPVADGLRHLIEILRYQRAGLLNRSQFQSAVERLRVTLQKNGYFNCKYTMCEVLGVDHRDLERLRLVKCLHLPLHIVLQNGQRP